MFRFVYRIIVFIGLLVFFSAATMACEELDWAPSDEFCLEKQQFLSAQQQSCIPFLLEEYDVIDFDIRTEWILLHMSDHDQSFLRLALWNDTLGQYSTMDTDWLPAESNLDTYHAIDSDSVLLTVPYKEENMVTGCIPTYDWLYLTFDRVEDDWYLTHFTDGQTFVAELQNEAYLFGDYYETSEEYAWQAPHVFSFRGFKWTELFPYISAYHSAVPNRPSLMEMP